MSGAASPLTRAPGNRVLLTGATGLVGRTVLSNLLSAGFNVTTAGRGPSTARIGEVHHVAVGEIGAATDWRQALKDCRTVVHLAAQVPFRDVANERFDEVNDRGTARLIDCARDSQVDRFVFMSSVFAMTGNAAECVVDEQTPPRPTTAYGRSKLAGETHVLDFGQGGRMAVVLRPPLVYAAHAKGNWQLLQKLAASGMPLPFASIRNRRSLIALDNLADAVMRVLMASAEALASRAYLVADDEPASLSQVVLWLREGMGCDPRQFPLPPTAINGVLRTMGLGSVADSLLGDLVVDTSLFRRSFAWRPPHATGDAVRQAGAAFRS